MAFNYIYFKLVVINILCSLKYIGCYKKYKIFIKMAVINFKRGKKNLIQPITIRKLS